MNVAVLGAGAMGQRIARASARASHEMTIRDPEGGHVRSGSGAIEVVQERIDQENVAPAGHEGTFGRTADTRPASTTSRARTSLSRRSPGG